jgi:hypothetical protein
MNQTRKAAKTRTGSKGQRRRKVSSNALKVRLRRPHEKQRRFLRSRAKRKVIRAGRRGGKTTGIAIEAVEYFLAGMRVLYGAPTQEQVDAFWFEVKRALAEPIEAGYFRKNETKHTIERPGLKSRIKAKTCWNADTLRGDMADLLILDEFQLMDESAWTIVGAPMLIDNDGDAVFIYTPPSAITRSRSRAKDPKFAAKLFKRAAHDETGRWEAFHFSSMENPYLNRNALAEISDDMSATAYRQEILAEDLDEVPGALWTREVVDGCRISEDKVPPSILKLVVGVDPPGGATECGIIAAGVAMCRCKGTAELHGFVFDDKSLEGNPKKWGTAAVDLYEAREADRIVGEVNYGGDMVEATVKAVDEDVRFKSVRATRGKAVRAEPISTLYEKGRVHHVGAFPALEDEMCTWLPDISSYSPNRMDALVWAITDLMVRKKKRAGIW